MTAHRTSRGTTPLRRVAVALVAAVAAALTVAASPPSASSGRGHPFCEPLLVYREGEPLGSGSTIMGVPVSGGEPHVVHDGPWSELDPDWSPSGRHLVYATRLNAGGVVSERGLDILDVRTGEVRTLLREDPSFPRYPDWSPEGDRIAYVTSRGADRPLAAVRVVDVDGPGDQLAATVPAPEVLRDVSWHPDGTRLLLSSWNPTTNGWTVRIVDLDSGTVTVLDDTRRLGFVRVLPTGHHVVVEGDGVREDGTASTALYLSDLDDLSPLVPLLGEPEFEWAPELSPWGTQLAFIRYDDSAPQTHGIHAVSLLTGAERELVAPRATGLAETREGLSWQPKGRCVAGYPY